MIDLLASAYGWSKKQILEDVYPDEVEEFQMSIIRRQTLDYQVRLQIVRNPHSTKPEALDELFEKMLIQTGGLDPEHELQSTIDHEGIKMLKSIIASNNSGMKAK